MVNGERCRECLYVSLKKDSGVKRLLTVFLLANYTMTSQFSSDE